MEGVALEHKQPDPHFAAQHMLTQPPSDHAQT